MPSLNVAVVQYSIEWENKTANFRKIEKFCDQKEALDLIVLPEMFSTGFSMNVSSLAEEMDGQTVKWMQQLAGNKNAAVCGSAIIRENNLFFNRFLFVHPDGKVEKYDKHHLFTMGEEQHYYFPGNKKIIIAYKGFRILPLICYDLRFPVWSRNRNDYDLMIYVANWPAPRYSAWKALLRARAIENQSFVVAANRTGTDANGIKYCGGSFIIDAKGKIIQKLPKNWEGVIAEKYNLDSLMKFREKFPVLKDAD